MAERTLVLIDDIVIPDNRMRTANHIEELASSIRINGLLHPITLRRDGDKLILIAGLRRLQAMQLLFSGEIPALILDIDETQALMIEIDENLQRAELTELQRGQHIAERKRLWESLHPETRHGGTPGAGRGKQKKPLREESDSQSGQLVHFVSSDNNAPVQAEPVPSFVDATAQVVQQTPRSVRRSTRIGTKIARPAQDLLHGTRIEDNQRELLRLAGIKDAEKQVQIAQLIHDGEAVSVLRAQRQLEADALEAAPPPLPEGPFRTIVIDPPWAYYKRPDDPTKRENVQYATLTIDEIKALPIPTLAEPDALLWLWTTNAHLPKAFDVLEAWGFAYKTLLTWDKVTMGMGDWLRGQTEHCLLGVRGEAGVLLTHQSTLIREQSTRHSQKPEAFYVLVESLCPGSKLSLFARESREGWTVWGNMDAAKPAPLPDFEPQEALFS